MKSLLLLITLSTAITSCGQNPEGPSSLKSEAINPEASVLECKISHNELIIEDGGYQTGGGLEVIKTFTMTLESNSNSEGNYTAWNKLYFKSNSIDQILETGKLISEVQEDSEGTFYTLLTGISKWQEAADVKDHVLISSTLFSGKAAGFPLAGASARNSDFNEDFSLELSPKTERQLFSLNLDVNCTKKI